MSQNLPRFDFNRDYVPSLRSNPHHIRTYYDNGVYRKNPTFGQTISASFGYTYSPLANWAVAHSDPEYTRVDQNYLNSETFNKAIESFAPEYHSYLAGANNEKHMKFLQNTIIQGQQRREILSDSPLFSQFVAGFFDPVNFIALPFGGPALGVARSATRVGAGVGVLVAGQEALRIPFDPDASFEEAYYSIGSGILFGGAMGAIFGAMPKLRNQIETKAKKEVIEANKIYDDPDFQQIEMHKQTRITDPDKLGLKQKTSEQLKIDIEEFDAQIKGATKLNDRLSQAIKFFKTIEKQPDGFKSGELSLPVQYGNFESYFKAIKKLALADAVSLKAAGDTGFLAAKRAIINNWERKNKRQAPNNLKDETIVANSTDDLLRTLAIGKSKKEVELLQEIAGLKNKLRDRLKKEVNSLNAKEKSQIVRDYINARKLPNKDNFDIVLQKDLENLIETPVLPLVKKVYEMKGKVLEANAWRGDKEFNDIGVRFIDVNGKKQFMKLTNREHLRPLFEGNKFIPQTDPQGNRLSLTGNHTIDFNNARRMAENKLGNQIQKNNTRIAEFQDKIQQLEIEQRLRLKEKYEFDINYVSNMFTDGVLKWAYNSIPTPMKTIISSKVIPNPVKEMALKLANDYGMAYTFQMAGRALGGSVFIAKGQHVGEVIALKRDMLDIWRQDRLQISDYQTSDAILTIKKTVRNYTGAKGGFNKADETFADFSKRMTNHYIINNTDDLTAGEKSAVELIKKHFQRQEAKLVNEGLIGDSRPLQAKQDIIKSDIARIEDMLENGVLVFNEKQNKFIRVELKKNTRTYFVNQRLPDLNRRVKNLDNEIKVVRETKGALENFFPRYWDREAIKRNKDRFIKILEQYYIGKKYVYFKGKNRDVTEKLLTVDESKQRAQDVYKEIMDMKDVMDFEEGFFGANVSKHMRHRKIDIPNELVKDFIVTDIQAVATAYAHRTMPMYEMKRKFGYTSQEDFINEITDRMVINGNTQEEINEAVMNMAVMYERVVGRVIDSPDKMSFVTFNALKIAARFSYLGQAGLAAITEVGALFLNHEIKTIRNSLLDFMDDSFARNMSKKDAQINGEMAEIAMGQAHMRIESGSDRPNMLNPSFWDKAQHLFFMGNGLGPITHILKWWDSMARGHTIIDYSLKVKDGTAKPMEISWLAKYDIDADTAKLIADSPHKMGRNGTRYADVSEWTNDIAKERYGGALSGGIMNTIMMSTPADKPIMMDGRVYVKHSIAKKWGYPEDPRVKGYSRMESGILSAPFQFYTYAFAALNKITVAYVSGHAKNRALTAMMYIGLGYFAVKMKTPSWAWDKMDYEDRFMRAFDQSGMAALYSDIYYTSMHTINALGGPDIGLGFINPKFQDTQIGALVGITGSAPSVAQDYFLALQEFTTGDTGKGMKDILSATGISRFYWWRDSMQELGRTLDKTFD
ncbi:MAG: putative peptidoglycan hydrolase [Prokaryotic dsDNA virus sp.]|nr:MAG: putative peptidoglycan hydrolase [Prokaryotic dsDNA virus sp.]|tara:strand:- start:16774 stop:21063 length:4290 start_codon:yes stop_codon:yes gene_type:complete